MKGERIQSKSIQIWPKIPYIYFFTPMVNCNYTIKKKRKSRKHKIH